ncbi:MAG: PAS domain S-box protein [Oscillochloris sp.]|nr:PAS domain S-box protein [Oscillochloris sp.]
MSQTYELTLAESLSAELQHMFPSAERLPDEGTTRLRITLADQAELADLLQRIDRHKLTLLNLRRADSPDPLALLREKDAQYRAIFEASNDGMIIRDPGGRIIEANPAYCRMHGTTREAMIGRIQDRPLDPERQHIFDTYLATVNSGRIFRAQVFQNDSSGRQFPAEALGIPFQINGKPHILGIVRDISDQVQTAALLEERANERTRELATLLEVSRQVASTRDLEPLLRTVLDQLRAVMPFAAATFNLCEEPNRLKLMLYEGPIPQALLPQHWSIGPARPQGTPVEELIAEIDQADPQAFGREVVYSGQPVIIPDVSADTALARAFRSRVSAILGGTVPQYIGCWMGVPLIYRDEVIGMLDFDHGEPGGFSERQARLALGAASQAAIAIVNTQLLAEAQGKAALEERQRLARELHDAVTQQLFSASLIGEVLPQIWAANQAKGAEYLEDLRLLTKGALAEMRALLVELRPAAITDTPLPDLLQHLTAALSGRLRVPVELQTTGDEPVPADVQLALYRFAQEALQNVAKHARAQHVLVTLQLAAGAAMLVVRDDGRGFVPEAVGGDHFGLTIMRERLESVGGSVTLTSAPGAGTTLSAHWHTT